MSRSKNEFTTALLRVFLRILRKSCLTGVFGFFLGCTATLSYISLQSWSTQPLDFGMPTCSQPPNVGRHCYDNTTGEKYYSKTTYCTRQVATSHQDLESLATKFYQHHLSSMKLFINESTALDWDARSDTPFGPFKNQLKEDLYVVPWHPPEDFRPLLNRSRYIVWRDICAAAKAFGQYRNDDSHNKPLPHVLILRMNENWGEFAIPIENRTKNLPKMLSLTGEKAWKEKGCSRKDILDYLDHPDTRAAVTTQHQLWAHPKLHSLPLGVKSWNPDLRRLLQVLDNSTVAQRPQLLMVNSRPRKMREEIIERVIRNFNGTVRNTFGTRYGLYLDELRQSKFILSPPGLGLDCYRHWEALYMGTIPVLEHLNRTDGWHRNFEHLPVAWIDHYDNLTADWLENVAYPQLVANHGNYNYFKLTRQWWIHKIQSSLS
jgi:hypothetical protein